MFNIIKDSYKFLVFNFHKVLWTISGLLFLELGSRWLILDYQKALWFGVAVFTLHLIILFTKIYVVIDLNKLVFSQEKSKKYNQTLIYMKILCFFVVVDVTSYLLSMGFEHIFPNSLEKQWQVIIFLGIQAILGIGVFIYAYARLNIIIPISVSNNKVKELMSITKDRYINWILAVVLIYLPCITINLFALTSYILTIAKVVSIAMIYIFSAMYLKNKTKTYTE